MKKVLFSMLLFVNFSFAENFGNMSTQELIAIMGYVKESQEVKFLRELETRVGYMSQKQKEIYEKKLKKYYNK